MPDRTNNYFAYGSNLHPLRLGLRTPSCRVRGVAELSGFRLAFHKRSEVDGSAKADAVATGTPGDRLRGVVFTLEPADFPALDRVEGVGTGYALEQATVALDGAETPVFFYVAEASHVDPRLRPWAWYRDLIVAGACWHGFPADYVAALGAAPAAPDPDTERAERNARLLAAFPGWMPEHGYALP